MTRPVYSVSELNGLVKSLIENNDILSDVCIAGEISNYKVYPSGHHYFTLKDSESALSCVMFRSNAASLRFRPENGMSILAIGRVSVYQRDGKYQLICSYLHPAGAGDLQVAFEQLKKKLEAEGLFDPVYKKQLPDFPEKIALITSPAGAAVHDMIRILGARWPLSEILVVPVRVQGAEAPGEICEAIEYVNKKKLADLIITGRGGGSIEDLWAFNEEIVARAIFQSQIPVISAVGHEPDVTISDYVADVRASTPSNAAERAVPDSREILSLLSGYQDQLSFYLNKKISSSRNNLNSFAQNPVLRNADGFFNLRRMELDHLQDKISSSMLLKLKESSNNLSRISGKLDAMSPLKVLSRGYSIASAKDGKILTSVSSISAGDRIRLKLSDGSAECTVDNIKES